ncbi:MAG: DPP IV N-terminal domain-containing protein [Bacteroides cellulosilyticus]
MVFLPWDNNKFIYQSQRDGFNHLYLYNVKGELLKQLTPRRMACTRSIWIQPWKRKTSSSRVPEYSPLQSNIYSVSLKDCKRSLLGRPEGIHSAQLSGFMGTHLIDKSSSPTCHAASTSSPHEKTGIAQSAYSRKSVQGLHHAEHRNRHHQGCRRCD